MKTLFTALLFLTFAFARPALAQEMQTQFTFPEGATMVSLSATERVEVSQDLLTAQLSYESENQSAANLQDEINKVMKQAVDTAKKVSSVKVSTQSYQVYPQDYAPDPVKSPGKTVRQWRGSQSLLLKSKAPADLLALTGKLQELGLNVTALYYSISPELMEETQNSLLEAALGKLKTKAERTAKALGKAKADLLNVAVDTGGYQPPVPMMASGVMMKAEMARDAAPPVAEAGQSDITLTVSANALIK
jgi:predicted secreted protein